MSPVEPTSTHQSHSDSAFNNACAKLEWFSKTCSRVRQNSGAFPHDHDVPNSGESGYNKTRTALARKRLIMWRHWRAACVSLPVHCDSFVWVSSRIASYRWADAAPLAGSNFNTISPGYECSTCVCRCESVIDLHQSQAWTMSGRPRPGCWCAALPGSPPP